MHGSPIVDSLRYTCQKQAGSQVRPTSTCSLATHFAKQI